MLPTSPTILSSLRDPQCSRCKLGTGVESNTCIISQGPLNPPVLVVTKHPMSAFLRKELEKYLDQAGVPTPRAYTSAIKCLSDIDAGKTEVKACASYLHDEIRILRPRAILALGSEPLLALTGRVGIMKYRARQETVEETPAFFTISPAMVHRNPGLHAGFIADLQYFTRLATGESAPTGLPDVIHNVMTRVGLKTLKTRLATAEGVSFDIETGGFDEFKPDALIASLSFTIWNGTDDVSVWALPLAHPDSPWVTKWQKVLRVFAQELCRPGLKVVAHNGKFDSRWLHQFGVPIKLTFDTMLAAHLLDENRPKGLKPLAQSLLGATPWDIDATKVMGTPLPRVLKYNALDTWYTYQLYLLFKQQLKEQPRLGNIMAKLMVPASNVFIEVERLGIWVDRERLASRAAETRRKLEQIDQDLLTHIPPRSQWPPELQKADVNFRPSNFSRWWLFDYLKYPVLARGKTKEDGTPGKPSMAEAVMLKLQAEHPDDPVLCGMIERTKWEKYDSGFFSAYEELVDESDHIHTTFKLAGTVTGRLSSGKSDDDKVSGRVTNRGVNLQQVPRDGFVRGVFGAPPGWVFVECDYSQVELRVAAFLAQEPTMLHLYQTGQDIHRATGQRMAGRVDITSEERKKAKAVNFGFLYGMGWAKFIDTAWSNYGVVVSEEESRAFRQAFFQQFSKLPQWHARQRQLVRKYKRVESPLGRVRHLPDIDSTNEAVSAEAARQAINSPVQSFASDMCLLSLVLLDQRLKRRGLRARSVGTIHDAINLVVPIEEIEEVVPLIRRTMENLPLERMFGVNLNVPIVADVKLGRYWGDTKEIPNDISCDPHKLKQFIQENHQSLGV